MLTNRKLSTAQTVIQIEVHSATHPTPITFAHTYANDQENVLEAMLHACIVALGPHDNGAPLSLADTEMSCDVEDAVIPISSDSQVRQLIASQVLSGDPLRVTLQPRARRPKNMVTTVACSFEGNTEQFKFKYTQNAELLLTVLLNECITELELEMSGALELKSTLLDCSLTSDNQVRELLLQVPSGSVLNLSLQRRATKPKANVVLVSCTYKSNTGQFKFKYTQNQESLLTSLRNECITELELEKSATLEIVCQVDDTSVPMTSDSQVREILGTFQAGKALQLSLHRPAPKEKPTIVPISCSFEGNTQQFKFKYTQNAELLLTVLLNECITELELEMSGALELLCQVDDGSVPLTSDSQVRELLGAGNALQLTLQRPPAKAKSAIVMVASSFEGNTQQFKFKYTQNEESLMTALQNECLSELELEMSGVLDFTCQVDDGSVFPLTSDSQVRELLANVSSNAALRVSLQRPSAKPKQNVVHVACTFEGNTEQFKFRYLHNQEALLATFQNECITEHELELLGALELTVDYEQMVVPLTSDSQFREFLGHVSRDSVFRVSLRRAAAKAKHVSLNVACTHEGSSVEFRFKFTEGQTCLLAYLVSECFIELEVDPVKNRSLELALEGLSPSVPLTKDALLQEAIGKALTHNETLRLVLAAPAASPHTKKITCRHGVAGTPVTLSFDHSPATSQLPDFKKACINALRLGADDVLLFLEGSQNVPLTTDRVLDGVLGSAGPFRIRVERIPEEVHSFLVSCTYTDTVAEFRFRSSSDLKALRQDCLWEHDVSDSVDTNLMYESDIVTDTLLPSILAAHVGKKTALHFRLVKVADTSVLTVNLTYVEGTCANFKFRFSNTQENLLTALKSECAAQSFIPEKDIALAYDTALERVSLTTDRVLREILCTHAATTPWAPIKLHAERESIVMMVTVHCTLEDTDTVAEWKLKYTLGDHAILGQLKKDCRWELDIDASTDVELTWENGAELISLDTDRVLREVLQQTTSGEKGSKVFAFRLRRVIAKPAAEVKTVTVQSHLDDGTDVEFQFKYVVGQDVTILSDLKRDCLWEHDIDGKSDVELYLCRAGTEPFLLDTDRVLGEVLSQHGAGTPFAIWLAKKAVVTNIVTVRAEGVEFRFSYIQDQASLLSIFKKECLLQLEWDASLDVDVTCTTSDGPVVIMGDHPLSGVLAGHDHAQPLVVSVQRVQTKHSIPVSLSEVGVPGHVQIRFLYAHGQDTILNQLKDACVRELECDGNVMLVCVVGDESVPLTSDRVLREVLSARDAQRALVIRVEKIASVRTILVAAALDGVIAEFRFKFAVGSEDLLANLKRDALWEHDLSSIAGITVDATAEDVGKVPNGGSLAITLSRPQPKQQRAVFVEPEAALDSLKVICTHYYGAHRDVSEFTFNTTPLDPYPAFCASLLQRCSSEHDIDDSDRCSVVCHLDGVDCTLASAEVQRYLTSRVDELHCTLHVAQSGGSTFGRTLLLRYDGAVQTLSLSMHPSQVYVQTLSEMVLRKLGFKTHSSFLLFYEDGSEVFPLTSDEQLFGILSNGDPNTPLSFVVRKRESVWEMNPQATANKTDTDHQRERIVDHVMFFWDLDTNETVPYEHVFQLVSTFTVDGRYLTVEDALLRSCEKFKSTCPEGGIVHCELKTLLVEWTRHMNIPHMQAFAEHAIETLHFTYELSAQTRLRKAAWEAFSALDVSGTHRISYNHLLARLESFPDIKSCPLDRYFGPEPGDDMLTLAAYRKGMWRLLMDVDELRGHEVLYHIQASQITSSPTNNGGTKQQKATRTRLDALRIARLHSEIRHTFDCVLARHIDAFTNMYVVSSVVPLMVAACTLLDIKVVETDIPQLQHWNAVTNAVRENSGEFLLSFSTFHEDERTGRLTRQKVAKVVPLLMTRDFQPEAIFKHGWFISALSSWCRSVCEFACVIHGWAWPCIEAQEGGTLAETPAPVVVEKVTASSRGRPLSATPTKPTDSRNPATPQRPQTARKGSQVTPGRPNSAYSPRRRVSERNPPATDHNEVMEELNADLGLTTPMAWEVRHSQLPATRLTPSRPSM